MLHRLILLFLLMPALPTLGAPDDSGNDLDALRSRMSREWLLVKNDRLHKIRTYARLEDGKRYRSFKVEAVIDSRMEPVARVLLDFPNYTRWFWKTQEARLLRQESPTEYFVYMKHDAPYGLPDRDTVLKATVETQAKGRPYATLKTTAVPDLIPVKPPLVRIIAEEMTIRITPVARNQVEIHVEGYFDPGGVVPPWAANLVQRNAPYAVMLAIQDMTGREEYRQGRTPLPFTVYEFGNLP
mgnify:CR=1 FL=1